MEWWVFVVWWCEIGGVGGVWEEGGRGRGWRSGERGSMRIDAEGGEQGWAAGVAVCGWEWLWCGEVMEGWVWSVGVGGGGGGCDVAGERGGRAG